jgi:hypothetical protein
MKRQARMSIIDLDNKVVTDTKSSLFAKTPSNITFSNNQAAGAIIPPKQPPKPIFKFCRDEEWLPIGVEDSLEYAQPRIPRSASKFFSGLKKRPLWDKSERMDFPSDMKPMPNQNLMSSVYYRCARGAGLFWHQYWLWYLYNSKSYEGFGVHEGDWEFVQIACDYEGYPCMMTCSQHHTGGKREYWTVELDTPRSLRPVVYVALGSHANYFSKIDTIEDVATGDGYTLRNYELKVFGDWINWKGLWGNSTGVGKSPETPSMQGHRWRNPHLFHSSARSS